MKIKDAEYNLEDLYKGNYSSSLWNYLLNSINVPLTVMYHESAHRIMSSG